VTGATGVARETLADDAGEILTVDTATATGAPTEAASEPDTAVDCTVSYEGRVNHTEARASLTLGKRLTDSEPWGDFA